MSLLSDARARSAALAASLWLFGIFTSVLLVGVWGRAVSGDEATLAESARTVLESDIVNDRIDGWLTDGLTANLAMTPAAVSGVAAMVADSTEMDSALDLAVDEIVTAALSPPGTAPSVDLSPAVTILGPAVSRALAAAGMGVEPGIVEAAISDSDLVLSSTEGRWSSGVAHRAGATLTWVLVVGLIGIVATGAVATLLSEDRVGRIRSLAWRVALSSVTFALMLRLGSWAVDPSGGRSPVAGAASVVLGSNGHVPLTLAAAGGMVAVLVGWRRRRPSTPEGRSALVPGRIE